MPSSNAYLGGKPRVNFAQFHGGRVPDLTAEFDPTVLSNATLVNHDDLDTDIFFDACEACGDDANAKKADDHDLNGNKDSSPRNPSRFLPISISRRAAQYGKSALLALKYIATHELAGVLQPITSALSSSEYVPKRQIQKCLIILVFMCMFCMTASMTSMTLCGHLTYIETSSTLSHMVTPLVVYSAMSSAITRVTDWYESTMSILTKELFPTPHCRYSNLRSHVCTSDPYYVRSSLSGNDLFRNISMTGSNRTAEMDSALVCLHLNFETKNTKIGMLDSGCNNDIHR
jgi:hypothetical protein